MLGPGRRHYPSMSVLCVMYNEWVYRKSGMLGGKWRKKEEEGGIKRAVGTSEQEHFILRNPHHKTLLMAQPGPQRCFGGGMMGASDRH